MKQLIINADDFGMSQEVNEGIKQGINAGIITSVSVMVNMPYYDDAITYLRKHPEVSIGLHFNITESSPISSRTEVTTLIREDGNFFYWIIMLVLLLFKNISLKEIETELSAQYKKLKRSQINISHIDSHHHIHLFPILFKMTMEFAQKNNIKALRCRAFNPKRLPLWIKNPPTIKQFIIILLCVIDSTLLTQNKKIYEISNLYDIGWDASLDVKKLIRFLTQLPDGITEIICHPAILSKTGNPKFLEPRHKGLVLLLNRKIKSFIKKNSIALTHRV